MYVDVCIFLTLVAFALTGGVFIYVGREGSDALVEVFLISFSLLFSLLAGLSWFNAYTVSGGVTVSVEDTTTVAYVCLAMFVVNAVMAFMWAVDKARRAVSGDLLE